MCVAVATLLPVNLCSLKMGRHYQAAHNVTTAIKGFMIMYLSYTDVEDVELILVRSAEISGRDH